MSYVGSPKHSPNNLRPNMVARANRTAHTLGFNFTAYYGPKWREIMGNSVFSLVPRGFGRTAFHLVETLQMGLLPIYVYSDVPWLPYDHIFRRFGYATTVDALPQLLHRLFWTPLSQLKRREGLVMRFAQLHLPPQAIMEHIGRFLRGRPSDLRCVKLPQTPN